MATLIIRYNELGKPVTVAEAETVQEAEKIALQLATNEPGASFHIRGENGELVATVKRGSENA